MPNVIIIPQYLEGSSVSGAFKVTGIAIESDNETLIGWEAHPQYSDSASQKNDTIRAAVVAEFALASITVATEDRKDIIGGAV